jgi:hypothetical protein
MTGYGLEAYQLHPRKKNGLRVSLVSNTAPKTDSGTTGSV